MSKHHLRVKNKLYRIKEAILSSMSWIPLTLLVGICFSHTIFYLTHSSQIKNLGVNQLDIRYRYQLLIFIAGAVVMIPLFSFLGNRYLLKRNELTFSQCCKSLNRYAPLLVAFPIFFFLGADGVAGNHPLLTLFFCVTIGGLVALVAYRSNCAIKWPVQSVKTKWIFLVAIVCFFAIYVFLISKLHIAHHRSLQTATWDLALYVNSVWNSFQGDFLACSLLSEGTHISRHFDPILFVISPLMAISPTAETLLVFQSIWVGLGAIPIYLLTLHHLNKPWMGAAVALVYLLHPAIHGANMFEFHSLTLVGTSILWMLYFLETGRPKWFYLILPVLLLTREETAVFSFVMGIYAIAEKKYYRMGIITMILSTLYFLLVKLVIMEQSKDYSYYLADLLIEDYSLTTSIVFTSLTNPLYIIKYMLSEAKITYVLMLLSPLLAIPLFSGKMWIHFIYGLVFVGFAKREAVFQINRHYSIVLIPFFFAAVPIALNRICNSGFVRKFKLDPARLKTALVFGMLFGCVCISYNYGALWPNDRFRAGRYKLVRTVSDDDQKRYQTLLKIKEMIPPTATVMASEHLTSHFASRKTVWYLQTEKIQEKEAQYVVVLKSDGRRKKYKPRFKALKKSADYSLILEENDIFVYKRI